MQPTPSEHPDRQRFEEICAELGDWEPLPTVVMEAPDPSEPPPPDDGYEHDSPLDGQILAGLVCP